MDDVRVVQKCMWNTPMQRSIVYSRIENCVNGKILRFQQRWIFIKYSLWWVLLVCRITNHNVSFDILCDDSLHHKISTGWLVKEETFSYFLILHLVHFLIKSTHKKLMEKIVWCSWNVRIEIEIQIENLHSRDHYVQFLRYRHPKEPRPDTFKIGDFWK